MGLAKCTLAVRVSSVWAYRQRLVAGIKWQSSVPVHSAALHLNTIMPIQLNAIKCSNTNQHNVLGRCCTWNL